MELTWNLNTGLGLSHHTEGIVVDVLKKDGADDILLVEFPSYRGIWGLPNEKGENVIIPIMMYENRNTSLKV